MPTTSPMWPAERVIRFTALCETTRPALSYAEIAAIMSAEFHSFYNRNMCIGKAARMGLDKPNVAGYAYLKRANAVRKARGMFPRRPVRALPTPTETHHQLICEPFPDGSVIFSELGTHSCRWPYGNDARTFRYCGAETGDGVPYCGFHLPIANPALRP